MTHPSQRRSWTRTELAAMTERLTAEYAGRIAPGTVERCVHRSREQLLSAGVRAGIVMATELSVRRQLRDVVLAHAAS